MLATDVSLSTGDTLSEFPEMSMGFLETLLIFINQGISSDWFARGMNFHYMSSPGGQRGGQNHFGKASSLRKVTCPFPSTIIPILGVPPGRGNASINEIR